MKSIHSHGFRSSWRLLCLSLALMMVIAPLSTFAIPQQQSDSTAIAAAKEEPVVMGYSVDPTFGDAPLEVNIEINARASQQMKVETEHGEQLRGSTAFSRDASDNNVFKLKTSFSDGYDGMLYIFLKNMDDQWVKSDIEFSVSYDDAPKATATRKPTAAPKPTAKPTAVPTKTPKPDGYIYERNSSSTWAITGYTGTDTSLDIPREYMGEAVTEIAPYAFSRILI